MVCPSIWVARYFLIIKFRLHIIGKNVAEKIFCAFLSEQWIIGVAHDTDMSSLMMMLILITCFRWYLPGFSTVRLLLSPFVINKHFERRYLTLCKYPIYDYIFTTNLASSEESCLKKLITVFTKWWFSISTITSTVTNCHYTVIKELPFPPFISPILFIISWTIVSITHYHHYFLAQLSLMWPLRVTSGWLLCPFNMFPSFF